VSIVATGQSGTTYQFQVHPAHTAFLALPGVYEMLQLGADGRYYAGYIGEAEDLNERVGGYLTFHEKWERARVWGATHIGVLIVRGDRNARLKIETDLRHAYNPPLNDQ
jgi:excinuclease UvrABC nuclease subunit